MMVFHTFEFLADAVLGEWEELQWLIASLIFDSLVRSFRNT